MLGEEATIAPFAVERSAPAALNGLHTIVGGDPVHASGLNLRFALALSDVATSLDRRLLVASAGSEVSYDE